MPFLWTEIPWLRGMMDDISADIYFLLSLPLSLDPLSLFPLSFDPLLLDPLWLDPLSLDPLSLDLNHTWTEMFQGVLADLKMRRWKLFGTWAQHTKFSSRVTSTWTTLCDQLLQYLGLLLEGGFQLYPRWPPKKKQEQLHWSGKGRVGGWWRSRYIPLWTLANIPGTTFWRVLYLLPATSKMQ